MASETCGRDTLIFVPELGRMCVSSANLLGIKVIVLEESADCPANQINFGNFVKGSFKDPQAVKKLVDQVDIITTGIENINLDALEALANGDETVATRRVIVQPHESTIRTFQDKFDQKEYLIKRGIPLARSAAFKSGGDAKDVEKAVQSVGGGRVCLLKARKDAYDGRGNFVPNSTSDIPKAMEVLGDRDLYVEEWVPPQKGAGCSDRQNQKTKPDADWKTGTLAISVIESLQEDSIYKLVYCPPRKVD